MESHATFNDATAQSLIELGRQTAGPQTVQTITGNPVPFIIVNGVVKPLPELIFNEHAKAPERVKASVSVLDPQSFIEYYTLFNDANSRVFADGGSHPYRVHGCPVGHRGRAEDQHH